MSNKKSLFPDMQLNNLLQKQIAKIFKKKDLNTPEMQEFMAVVSDTYTKFENKRTVVSKKGRPEKKLIDLDNLQQAILNATDYAIIYTDTTGLIRSFNIGAEQMLGYKASELVDHFSPAIFHDNAEILVRAKELSRELGVTVKPGFDVIVARTKNGGIETNEWTCIRKDWSRITIQLSLSAINNSENKIVGYLGIARDVTEQKKAQAALQISEERYRGIVEKSTDIIYRADKAGNFTYVNPVAERVTGYTQAELSGKHFTELIKEEYRKAAKMFYRSQLEEAKRTTYYEFPIISKTGNEVWIGQSVQLSEGNDGQTEFTALAIDITERRNYERGIFLQNEKYRNIISNMNLGLLEVDLDEKVRFVNHAFTELSGFSEKEILGKKASELFLSDTQANLVREKTASRKKGLSDMYEVSVLNKNGESRWWMISGAPNYDDKGKLTGSIGIHLDITEKKHLEMALQSARLIAEESSRAKASFLANMSHEIRTPLNGIIGMIRELTYEGLPDKQMKYVKNASTASQHLLSVLNNILDISKIEAGEFSLEKHHFRLRDTLKEVKSIMSARAREKKLLLNLDAIDVKGSVYVGDSARIRQILLNILGNAVKFTEVGGIFIECKIIKKKENADTISISVEDTGIGMDELYLKDFFKKFSQEDTSTSRKHGGSGLGMAITRELVDIMGGTIHVSSKKNKGTIINLTFDLEIGDEDKLDKKHSALNIPDLSQLHILLVEDNEFNRLVAANTLKRYKCKLQHAANGKIALDLISKNNFDLVLMDLQMPVMDGFETTKAIRKLKLKMPIIALTANAFRSELEKCVAVGMNDYITKPFEEDKLIGMIIKTLNIAQVPQMARAKKRSEVPSGKMYSLEKLYALSENDKSYVKQMLDIFIEQATIFIPELKNAYSSGDLGKVFQMTHRLKPSLDIMNIAHTHEDIRFIEKAAREGNDTKQLGKSVAQLLRNLTLALDQIRREQR